MEIDQGGFNGRRSVKNHFVRKLLRLNREHPTKSDAIGIVRVYASFWNYLICNCVKFDQCFLHLHYFLSFSVFSICILSHLPVFSSSLFFLICQCFLHLHSFSSASAFFTFFTHSNVPVFSSSSLFLICQCFLHLHSFSSASAFLHLHPLSSASVFFCCRR